MASGGQSKALSAPSSLTTRWNHKPLIPLNSFWVRLSESTARANARKSSVRSKVEHVFGHQKNRFGLFIRTIFLARAEAKVTLANIAYNMDRLIFNERRDAMG